MDHITTTGVSAAGQAAAKRMARKVDPFDRLTWTDAESEYFTNVDIQFEASLPATISNGSAVHATYLIAKIFQKAKSTVHVLTGSLTRHSPEEDVDIWANKHLVKALGEFLERPGTRLEILSLKDIDQGKDTHPVFMALKGMPKSRVGIYKANKIFEELDIPHFMVMDGMSFRLETDTDKKKAVMELNNKKEAGKLESLFRVLCSSAQSIYPEPVSG